MKGSTSPTKPRQRQFDSALKMTPALQERIDLWKTEPAKSQFQVYGPMTGYLGTKFPIEHFLVKPQRLLRLEWFEKREKEESESSDIASGYEPSDNDCDSDSGDSTYGPTNDGSTSKGLASDVDMEVDSPFDIGREQKKRRVSDISVDSNNVLVTKKAPRYPDFSVESYWGADHDSNQRPDIVRIIIEIASGPPSAAVVGQLMEYMERAGTQRWQGRLLGIAVAQNQVYIVKISTEDLNPEVKADNIQWVSLFSPDLISAFDWIKEYAMAEHGELDYTYE